jgi:hypothetical protein
MKALRLQVVLALTASFLLSQEVFAQLPYETAPSQAGEPAQAIPTPPGMESVNASASDLYPSPLSQPHAAPGLNNPTATVGTNPATPGVVGTEVGLYSQQANGAAAGVVPAGDPWTELSQVAKAYETKWWFSAEGLFIQRSAARSQLLFSTTATGTPMLNAEDINFPMAATFQVSAIRKLGEESDVQVGYFQLDGWAAESSVVGSANMIVDGNGGSFTVTSGSARYISALHLGEINLRHQFDWLTVFSGLRMGELAERFRETGTETTGTALLTSNAINHLYGFQFGANAEIIGEHKPFSLDLFCKAGIYYNAVNLTLHREDASVNDTLYDREDHAAFIGETGISFNYQFTPHLSAGLFYQAAWLQGVALAPEQFNSADFATNSAWANCRGGVLYHGGGTGLEFKF